MLKAIDDHTAATAAPQAPRKARRREAPGMKAVGELLRRSGLEALHAKVREGKRLDFDDGMRLYRTDDLTAVGDPGGARERRSGDRTYFVRNLHINYTNICNKLCKFLLFYTAPNSQDGRGYTLTPAEAAAAWTGIATSRSGKSIWWPASIPNCPTATISIWSAP